MTIRPTTPADLPRLHDIFAIARRFMAATGNPHQWVEGYPREEFLLDDIQRGDSFVCCEDEKVVGTFVLRGGEDPTLLYMRARGPIAAPTPPSTALPAAER